jgi:hypothetical protein
VLLSARQSRTAFPYQTVISLSMALNLHDHLIQRCEQSHSAPISSNSSQLMVGTTGQSLTVASARITNLSTPNHRTGRSALLKTDKRHMRALLGSDPTRPGTIGQPKSTARDLDLICDWYVSTIKMMQYVTVCRFAKSWLKPNSDRSVMMIL